VDFVSAGDVVRLISTPGAPGALQKKPDDQPAQGGLGAENDILLPVPLGRQGVRLGLLGYRYEMRVRSRFLNSRSGVNSTWSSEASRGEVVSAGDLFAQLRHM